jgi:hypothetical protein
MMLPLSLVLLCQLMEGVVLCVLVNGSWKLSKRRHVYATMEYILPNFVEHPVPPNKPHTPFSKKEKD